MTRRLVRWILSAVCTLGMFASIPGAHAGIRMCVAAGADPALTLRSYLVTLTSTSPIQAIGGIRIDGQVHQANQFSGSTPVPTVFLNTVPSEVVAYDTHLTLGQSQFSAITGSSIVESNDQSNPAGLSVAPWNFGMGVFTQGTGGLMTLKPAYQSTNLSVLQIILPTRCGSIQESLSIALRAVVGGVSYDVTSANGVLVDPASITFGNVRVGTTATKSTLAWIDQTSPLSEDEEDFWFFGSSSPCFGPPWNGEHCVSLSRLGKTGIPYTFSPMSRGAFAGRGILDGAWGFYTGWVGIPLSGTGVGPVLDAEQAVGTTIQFGDIPAESFFDVFFDVGNATGDAELGDLTELTVDATIDQDAAGAFEILGEELLELAVGQNGQLHLRFNTAGLAPGEYLARLLLRTDVGAAAGATGAGESYSFTLRGTVLVPEPSILVAIIALAVRVLASRSRGRVIVWRPSGVGSPGVARMTGPLTTRCPRGSRYAGPRHPGGFLDASQGRL
jgi:hypothetical protein